MKDLAKKTTALIAGLLVSTSSASAQSCSTACSKSQPKTMREAIDTNLARESLHEWHKINWRTNASQALRDAQAQSKPIFVFFIVKQLKPSPTKWTGQKDDTGQT
jgi:hypothetical protein